MPISLQFRWSLIWLSLMIVCMLSDLQSQSSAVHLIIPSSVNVPRQSSGLPKGAPQLPTHERFATFLAGEFKSVFLLQNFRSDVSIQVTPALILATGEVSMKPVTLQPHSATTVDINAFLQEHSLSDKRGTAVMRYTFSPYEAVSGVVLASDDVHHLYVNSYAQSPEEYWQGTSYDGTLWAPDSDTKGSISIINTASEQRTIHLTFLVKGHSEEQPPITILPRHTYTLNIDDLAQRSRETGAGIHVEYSEYPGTILVEGHLINKNTGFEKYIHFLDKTLKYPNGTVRTQFLLLGQQPDEDGFPTGISFRSVAVIQNIDSTSVHVTPTLKYEQNGKAKSIDLKPLTLAVGESRVIDLSAEQKAGRVPPDFHQGSLKLDPNTDHASIVAELFDFNDKTGGFTIGPMFFAYPGRGTQSVWRTDESFQTTIMVENTATKDDIVTLQLFSDNGTYSKTFPVAAGALLKINLKQLQQQNVPDDNGHSLSDAYGSLSINGNNGLESKLSFDKLIHSAVDSDYVGLPGGPGSCVSVQDVFLFMVGSSNPYQIWEETDWTDGTVQQGPAFGTGSGNTSLLQITGTPNGDMATMVPTDSQSHIVAFFGPQTPVMDCPACSEDDATPEGECTVPPKNDFTLNGELISDGDSGSLQAVVSSGTASSYKWTFSAPQGAGNNPNVNFGTPTAAQTSTDGHWFALPNVSCPPADQPGAPARVAPYTITATVSFSSGVNTPVVHAAVLSVDFIWVTTARTGQASITGVPAMAPDNNGVWHMTGTGTMTRVLPVPQILVTPTSQFYNKTVQHEQVHVNQWNPGGLVGDLYIVADLFGQVSGFTSTSQTDLLNQYAAALSNYENTEVNIFNSRRTALEHQAYVVSDPISPQYMIQNCGRF
jgi:hypothetical protein